MLPINSRWSASPDHSTSKSVTTAYAVRIFNMLNQGVQRTEAFVQQRYYVIGLHKTLQSIRYKCFVCCRVEPQNINTFMAPLPGCYFQNENKQFAFGNCVLDFFSPFYFEEENDKDYYGFILTCMVMQAVQSSAEPHLIKDTFKTLTPVFTSRKCQIFDQYSDNGMTSLCANEEIKKD